MTSPLGKYSQIVASVLAVVIICAAVAFAALGIESGFVHDAALIALGAVFGSFATVNGLKAPVMAAHARLDAINAPRGPIAEAVVENQAQG